MPGSQKTGERVNKAQEADAREVFQKRNGLRNAISTTLAPTTRSLDLGPGENFAKRRETQAGEEEALKVIQPSVERLRPAEAIEKVDKSSRHELLSSPLKNDYRARIDKELDRLDEDGLKTALEFLKGQEMSRHFAGASDVDNAFPTAAPALWADRTTGREVSPGDFIRKHYGRWLVSRQLTRQHIRDLDRALYQTFSTWAGRRKDQLDDDLLSLFEDTSSKRVEAELMAHGIIEPKDAFARFPDDADEAVRLYNAALRRQNSL